MAKSNFEIREALLEDLHILKHFEQEIIRFERPFALNLKKDPIVYYDLKDLIQRKDAQVLVAIVQEKIVGSGYALIRNSEPFFEPDQYVYLGFMFVSPHHRGKGINGKITEKLVEWSKKRNLTEFQLDVYAENDSALKAYAKIGFKPDLLKMRFVVEE